MDLTSSKSKSGSFLAQKCSFLSHAVSVSYSTYSRELRPAAGATSELKPRLTIAYVPVYTRHEVRTCMRRPGSRRMLNRELQPSRPIPTGIRPVPASASAIAFIANIAAAAGVQSSSKSILFLSGNSMNRSRFNWRFTVEDNLHKLQ